MKTIKKYCAIILVCITLLCLASIHTFAASVTQDNIDFYFETTKDSYSILKQQKTLTLKMKPLPPFLKSLITEPRILQILNG